MYYIVCTLKVEVDPDVWDDLTGSGVALVTDMAEADSRSASEPR